jgi:peroxiredoxin (alkyl hydroperoxide reductase subunit C)
MAVKIGTPAPDFTLQSTKGKISLSDYKGKWVVLFTHPADFTPICSTEIPEFARRSKEFEELNCQLIGASVDSVFSHIAWIQ